MLYNFHHLIVHIVATILLCNASNRHLRRLNKIPGISNDYSLVKGLREVTYILGLAKLKCYTLSLMDSQSDVPSRQPIARLARSSCRE